MSTLIRLTLTIRNGSINTVTTDLLREGLINTL